MQVEFGGVTSAQWQACADVQQRMLQATMVREVLIAPADALSQFRDFLGATAGTVIPYQGDLSQLQQIQYRQPTAVPCAYCQHRVLPGSQCRNCGARS